MIHKVIGLVALVFILISCGSNPGNGNLSHDDSKVIEASIPEVLADPLEYDSKIISIEGVISHVCRHSGDKMRVLQEGSDLSIMVMLGDFTGQFDTGSEGSKVKLSGLLVTEVTNMHELAVHGHDEGHDCETTREAIEVMKARGLDPGIRAYIALANIESR